MQDHKPDWYSELSTSPFHGEPQPSKEQMHHMKERFSTHVQPKGFRWKLAIPSIVLAAALVLFLFPFVKFSSEIGNTPSSPPFAETNIPASSVPKESTTPTMQNQSQVIKMVKNFDIKKLRLMSVKLLGKTDIWAWGYDISQKGRLTLLSTSNSGETWDQITGFSDEAPGMFPGGDGLPFQQIAAGTFLDANTGWLAWVKDGRMTIEWIHDNKTILSSIQTAVPASVTVVQSLNFINSKEGFALLTGKSEANGEQKFLLQTKDAGQHWSLISSNAPGQFLLEDTIVNNLLMSANANGWIGIDGSQADALPSLYHTTNKGINWSKIKLPIGSATQVSPKVTGVSTPITDGKGNVTIVVALTGESIKYQITYHSSDNGASWDPVVDQKFNQPITEYSPLFNYVSSAIGYAVKGFDLFRTTDGGRNWKIISDDSLKRLASNYAGSINEIHFENEEIGYITVEGNDFNRMFLLTSNGGQTWTKLN